MSKDDDFDLELDFTPMADRFEKSSRLVLSSEKPTFIFGKNGTGKTTITDAIEKQFSNSHKVCVFKDFDGVVDENKRLNAVTIGTENVAIQRQLNLIEKEIETAKFELQKPVEGVSSLWTKQNDADMKYKTQIKFIDDFCTKSAREITDKLGLGRLYNIKNFKDDIANSPSLLDEKNRKKTELIIAERPKPNVGYMSFPEINFDDLKKTANRLITSVVTPAAVIKELVNDNDKQVFARHGMSIHKPGDVCAFCGNKLTEDRWNDLNSYFNDKVNQLEGEISKTIKVISGYIKEIKDLSPLDDHLFYENFSEDVRLLNGIIASEKLAIQDFLETLINALGNKKENIFKDCDEIIKDTPTGFEIIKEQVDILVARNNKFSEDIDKAKQKAKDQLRLHEVKKRLNSFDYEKHSRELALLKMSLEEARRNFENKNQWIKTSLEPKRNNLLSKTKNEKRIANIINKLLSSIGVRSFSLELIMDDEDRQKGQYLVRGKNGEIRDVSKLSKGEKNIIGFLYFVLSLSSIDDAREKIVVLDDPMTSNDDTMQYLMISQIQRLYKELKNKDIFLLLTHNCFFYLNVRDVEKQKKDDPGFYERYNNYHLLSDGSTTTIKKINKGTEDFKTNYEMLWEELCFLYEKDKPNLMIGCCRKICETYIKFNNINNFYKNNTSAKKLFNVNLHSIDDLDSEQNAHNRNGIKNILKDLFVDNGAENHFEFHWSDNNHK